MGLRRSEAFPRLLTPPFFPVAGRFYRAGQTGIDTSTGTANLGELRAVPISFSNRCTIDQTYIEVTVAAVGGKARLGLYKDEGNYPGALIIDTGEIATDAVAVVTVALATPFVADAYRQFWLVMITGVALATLRKASGPGSSAFPGFTAATDTVARAVLSKAQAYGPLPAIFPAGGTYNRSDAFQGVRIKP